MNALAVLFFFTAQPVTFFALRNRLEGSLIAILVTEKDSQSASLLRAQEFQNVDFWFFSFWREAEQFELRPRGRLEATEWEDEEEQRRRRRRRRNLNWNDGRAKIKSAEGFRMIHPLFCYRRLFGAEETRSRWWPATKREAQKRAQMRPRSGACI